MKWTKERERVYRAAMHWYRAYSAGKWAALMPMYNACEDCLSLKRKPPKIAVAEIPLWDRPIPKNQKRKLSICPKCGQRFYYWQLATRHANLKKHFGNYNP